MTPCPTRASPRPRLLPRVQTWVRSTWDIKEEQNSERSTYRCLAYILQCEIPSQQPGKKWTS
ncbi:hypothetical protein C8Q74DRAFT_1224474 [Fomes fomentarius]|nr:hypothetical protein C8Q74DRAFT_1224474 [Fomes fomentarius]